MTNHHIAQLTAAMRQHYAFITKHGYDAMLPYLRMTLQVSEMQGHYRTGD